MWEFLELEYIDDMVMIGLSWKLLDNWPDCGHYMYEGFRFFCFHSWDDIRNLAWGVG